MIRMRVVVQITASLHAQLILICNSINRLFISAWLLMERLFVVIRRQWELFQSGNKKRRIATKDREKTERPLTKQKNPCLFSMGTHSNDTGKVQLDVMKGEVTEAPWAPPISTSSTEDIGDPAGSLTSVRGPLFQPDQKSLLPLNKVCHSMNSFSKRDKNSDADKI